MWPITPEDFKICALLTFYAVYSGNSIPTFRENLSVPSSRIKKSNNNYFSYTSGTLKWDRKVVLKRRYGNTIVHCVIIQKSADII